MSQPHETPRSDEGSEIARVTREIASRLEARGVSVNDSDSPEDVVDILEAVEAFEGAVEARGGDLFVDEPPPNGDVTPDDPHFLLPNRSADESPSAYLKRLERAIEVVKQHRPLS